MSQESKPRMDVFNVDDYIDGYHVQTFLYYKFNLFLSVTHNSHGGPLRFSGQYTLCQRFLTNIKGQF